MKERILMNYSNKIIMMAFLFLFVVSGLSGKKVIDITDITVKVVGWINEYKNIYSRYPESISELLDSNIETLEVDHRERYQAYEEYGFLIKFDNKNLMLILEDRKKNKKCIYNFITKKYRLYIDGEFKDEYSVK
ncbi:hypothetical protein [Treponema denticola]|uniref:Uncharacterized protein n=1 Tax=Treponema denticola SP33 TaxID=999437 RepID=M2BRN5_TREDN|nr:hypothetical protein [Treponema denticola]EMB24168.1 hypothetical protein HMPREF9733_01617 [Treponema denticola SP33]EPF37630.1 hypothetical protein HMPREF9732_00221 [Treponema denticola SP32]